jgi:hypothetical protein
MRRLLRRRSVYPSDTTCTFTKDIERETLEIRNVNEVDHDAVHSSSLIFIFDNIRTRLDQEEPHLTMSGHRVKRATGDYDILIAR